MQIQTTEYFVVIQSQIIKFHAIKRENTAWNELSLFKVEEERRGVIQGV